MKVARSGYYFFKAGPLAARGNHDTRLIVEVRALHKQSKGSYGSRRISKALKIKGHNAGRYKARTLMKKAGVKCRQRRRFRVATDSKHSMPIAGNKLGRKFTVSIPNRVWAADITYLWTQEGWLYLAAIIDLFSRRVVGWSMADHMRDELVMRALNMAVKVRRPNKGLLHHSDRGVQYASANYQDLLDKSGLTVSMSRKGNCWDNAVMERFFGSLKTERTDGENYKSHAQARADVIDYIENFYNKERLHSTLNYLSPDQYEKINRSLFE